MCVCVCVWCDVVWCGVVWCGVVWCGVVWCGVVQSSHLFLLCDALQQAYRATIESKFGKDGAKLISMSITNFNKIVQSLNGDMRDKMQKVSGSGLLKDYSPWLAAFQANQYPQEIEVPGNEKGVHSTPFTLFSVSLSLFIPLLSFCPLPQPFTHSLYIFIPYYHSLSLTQTPSLPHAHSSHLLSHSLSHSV